MYGSLSVNGRDLRVELLAAVGDHLVGAPIMPNGVVQRAAGRVLERLARRERRLLADDARAADLFDVPVPSVMIQWRVSSCTVSSPSLVIVTV